MLEISLAVIKLTTIALLGYYFYKKNIIDQKILDFLIFFVVNFTIPFLAFSHLIENLKPGMQPAPIIFVLSAAVIFIIGFVLGYLFSFKRSHDFKKEFISVISFQNCGYLPLSIALFLFPAGLRERFIIYTFLYMIGFDIIMWSLGSFFIFKKKDEKFNLKSIVTAPIIATLTALLFIYSGIAKFIPAFILSPLRMVGDTSFVLSMVILGCWLARIDIKKLHNKFLLVAEASMLKLVVLPLIVLLLTLKFEFLSLFGLFIVIQASMPSAVTLPIVVNLRKADSEFVSQGVFFTHILSVITVPFWVGVYLKFSHFALY